MDHAWRDLRYAVRVLLRAPVFTATVLLTLGLGIGANTAIFGFVDAMLLRPLPYPDPDRMVMIWQDFGSTGGPVQEWFTPPDYVDLTERVRQLEAVTPLVGWGPNLTGAGEPVRLNGLIVSTDYFNVVGVAPALGRGFEEGDAIGEGRVVVLSHGLWQRNFGGDRAVLNRTIQLNGVDHTVIGVMPESFGAPFRAAELWRPYTAGVFGTGCGRGCYVMQVMGRVAADATVAQAGAEVTALGESLAAAFPSAKQGLRLKVVALHEQLVGASRPALYALLGGVGLMLLIACVNIANLLLARAGGREREVAVRSAIGASRGQVLRQLLTETVVLGIAGGMIGILLGLWGIDLLVRMSPAGTPRLDEVALNGRALAFSAILSIATGLLFGSLPALQLSRLDVSATLKELGTRAGVSRRRMRNALVVAEIAIALTLLTGAGLLVRSFSRLLAVDPGFDARQALAIPLQLPQARYPEPAQRNVFWDELVNEVRQTPGVIAAGAASILPLTGSNTDVGLILEGAPPPQSNVDGPVANYRSVTPGYFEAMGMRLLRGRGLEATDRAGTPLVAVINQTMADRYWPNEDAIGKRVSDGGSERQWTEIVGIVADVKHDGLEAPVRPEMWLPVEQVPDGAMTLVVRTQAEPVAMLPEIRAQVRALDAELPVGTVTTLDDLVWQNVAVPRLYVTFFAFFAAVALLLAAVGIFGVTQHAVAQRAQEIGIRIALGAKTRDVLAMVLRQSIVVTGLGLVIGLALGLSLSRLLSNLLYRTSPFDPVTYIAIVIVLGTVALVAALLPARRAAAVDPVVALRAQ